MRQTMEAVRRGFCDSRAWEGHVGEGGVASRGWGSETQELQRGHLTTAESRKPIGAPRSQPPSDRLCTAWKAFWNCISLSF